MKIAIISDSHDNLPNIEKALTYINGQGVELLIHCGDVCAPATLQFIAERFTKPIHLCFGNVDGDKYNMTRMAYEELHHVKIHGEIGELTLSGKHLAFVHYPYMAKGLATENKYDFIFYGHDHKPWEAMIGKTKIINPGNLANIFFKPSFALLDIKTGKLELKLLERL
jgi:putative phosphoesterase